MDKEIIKKSIKHYGKEIQLTVVMEECSELIQAVSKELRGNSDPEHIAEEIADVLISIEIIKEACKIKESSITSWINYKQARILKRMEEASDENKNELVKDEDTQLKLPPYEDSQNGIGGDVGIGWNKCLDWIREHNNL